MATTYRRNILVGATVLGAGLMFVWMVLKFSSKTAELFAPPQMPVHLHTLRANGLAQGSAVQYLGVDIGRVTALSRDADGTGVTVDLAVDRDPPLPANLHALITQTSALGGASIISLDVDGPKAVGKLAANAKLNADYVGLQLNLIPPSLSTTADQIGGMSEEIRLAAKQLRESGAIDDLDKTIKTVAAQALKAGAVFDSLHDVLGDPQTKSDLKESVANLRMTTEKLNKLADNLQTTTTEASDTVKDTRQHVDELSKQLGDRLTQMASVLSNVQSITEKINKGQGTAGQFVNDPRLYQALVDSSRELNATVSDLKRLIEQWEQEGVSLKLK